MDQRRLSKTARQIKNPEGNKIIGKKIRASHSRVLQMLITSRHPRWMPERRDPCRGIPDGSQYPYSGSRHPRWMPECRDWPIQWIPVKRGSICRYCHIKVSRIVARLVVDRIIVTVKPIERSSLLSLINSPKLLEFVKNWMEPLMWHGDSL